MVVNMMYKIIAALIALWCTSPVYAQFVNSGVNDNLPLGAAQDAGGPTGFTTVTPSASANTKGVYTQLIASTTNNTQAILIEITAVENNISNFSFLVDISTGAAASEVVLIPNVIAEAGAQFSVDVTSVLVPISIPAGTRIAARAQTNSGAGTNTVGVKLTLFQGGFGAVGVDAIGASTATSLGTLVTAGNGSKGAYSQLTASSAHNYKGLFFVLDTQAVALGSFPTCAIDIATGAAASEVVLLPNFITLYLSTNFVPVTSPYYPISISSGTRIAARAQCSGAATLGISVYGFF